MDNPDIFAESGALHPPTMTFTRRLLLKIAPFLFVRGSASAVDAPQPFGAEFPNLESLTTGEWWTKNAAAAAKNEKKKAKGKGGGGGWRQRTAAGGGGAPNALRSRDAQVL